MPVPRPVWEGQMGKYGQDVLGIGTLLMLVFVALVAFGVGI